MQVPLGPPTSINKEYAMKQWTTIDKSAWGDGPWSSEPDKVSWIDPETNLDCLIVRNASSGILCGYVGVDPTHAAHGLDYSNYAWDEDDDIVTPTEEAINEVSVHGGLTFAASCQVDEGDGSTGICHIPEPGRSHDIWWFGFDCAHVYDFRPGYKAMMQEVYETQDKLMDMGIIDGKLLSGFDDIETEYRNVSYVKSQVEQLAQQIAAIS